MNYEDDIIGCAYGCPAQLRKKDCPFNEIGHLSFKEKVIWMKRIDNNKKESIIQHHIFCSRNRSHFNFKTDSKI
jgi:hypothetical protein